MTKMKKRRRSKSGTSSRSTWVNDEYRRKVTDLLEWEFRE
jgi:hypothetical protein